MDELYKLLLKQQEKLDYYAKKLEECHTSNDAKREDKLIVKWKKHGPEYYKKDCTTKNLTYIRKDAIDVAKKLAQEEYEEKIMQCISTRKKCIKSLVACYEKTDICNCYEKMVEGRKELIQPILLGEKQYLYQWLEQTYPKKSISDNIQILTEKGEQVRSKSEKILADKFYAMNIPYLYEKPLFLKSVGIIYPDFTILDVKNRKEIYWEHFGMVDDEEYASKMVAKINAYIANGYRIGKELLLSFETKKQPLNMKTVEAQLKDFIE